MSQGDDNDVEYEIASDSTASGYHSFSDSDSEDDEAASTEEERKLEREMRAAERQLVLEAAGIVVKKDTTRRPHRPAPAPPTIPPTVPSSTQGPDLRVLPPSTPAKAHLDDAYERYEAFKQQRLSITSIEQLPPASPVSPSSGPLSFHSAQSHESLPDKEKGKDNASTSPSYGSRISQLLARSRTPVQEKETRVMPVISAPVTSATSSGTGTLGATAREDSQGFGLVRRTLTLQRETANLTGNRGVVGKPCGQVCSGRSARSRAAQARGMSSVWLHS
jgi:actin cytoskeleton-regulatory complex protein PAN1